MAYKNLVGQVCADEQEFFQRVRDFLCARVGTYDYSTTGVGWTLHDAVYAVDENTLTDGDYIVVYSAGESGDDDMYIKIRYSTTTSIFYIRGYLYWDNVSHTGVLPFSNADFSVVPLGTGYRLWLYGDMDAFSLIGYTGAAYSGYYFGKATDLLYADTVATSAGAVATGTDVVISLDAVPSTWVVGQSVFIRDTAAIVKITIKNIVGLNVTADITTAMAAGCKLQADISFTVPGYSYFGQQSYNIAAHDGTSGSAAAYLTGSWNASPPAACIPDTMNNDYIAVPLNFTDTAPDGYYGKAKNVLALANQHTNEDVLLVRSTGDSYRFFNMTSARTFCFLEV